MPRKSKSSKSRKPLVVAVLGDMRGPRKPPLRADGTPGIVKVQQPANATPFRRPRQP
jgi:hypothetical protein